MAWKTPFPRNEIRVSAILTQFFNSNLEGVNESFNSAFCQSCQEPTGNGLKVSPTRRDGASASRAWAAGMG